MNSISRFVFRVSCALACVVMSFSALAAAPAQDHALVGRYEGSDLVGVFVKDYDETSVMIGPILGSDRSGSAPGWQHLEGKISLYYYRLPEGRSSLEVLRNYEASLRDKGFDIAFSCATSDASCYMKRAGHAQDSAPYDFAMALDAAPELPRYKGDFIRNYFGTNARYLLARLNRDNGAVFVSISLAEGNRESLAIVRVVETKSMAAHKIAFVGAQEMQKGIAETGRISLYGIHFDFDKDAILPDSRPTLQEIAHLLKMDATLKLSIVGHTDAQGGSGYNLDLSRRRAANVAAALIQDYGIAPSRLQTGGAGANEPLATNDSDAGRAKNRRVELVRL